MTKEGIRLKIREIVIRFTAKSRNSKLENKDFTIISNNCWGGIVYESFNLPKQSPTVGLFFMAEEYLKFLKQFPDILDKDIEFIDPETSKYKDYLAEDKRFGSYPIGKLGNVEIAFLHYHSQKEVVDKWKRRCKRINFTNLIVKMNDQNQCTEENLIEFSNLPFKNKLIFTSYESKIPNSIWIKEARNQVSVLASQEPVVSHRYLDVIKYINRVVEK